MQVNITPPEGLSPAQLAQFNTMVNAFAKKLRIKFTTDASNDTKGVAKHDTFISDPPPRNLPQWRAGRGGWSNSALASLSTGDEHMGLYIAHGMAETAGLDNPGSHIVLVRGARFFEPRVAEGNIYLLQRGNERWTNNITPHNSSESLAHVTIGGVDHNLYIADGMALAGRGNGRDIVIAGGAGKFIAQVMGDDIFLIQQ